MVYVMAGVNDFTVLDRQSHTVRLVTPFISGLNTDEINALDASMKKSFPDVPYILCPIYGLDIIAYNEQEGVYRYQDVLDTAIGKVNDFIGKLNARNNQVNPFISSVIHRYRP